MEVEEKELLARTRVAYGDSFTSYVLAADDEDLDQLEITAPRRRSLQLLYNYVDSVERQKAEEQHVKMWGLRGTLASVLCPFYIHGDVSFTYELREACGGSFPETADQDEVKAHLMKLVSDAYPILLFPKDNPEAGRMVPFDGLSSVIHKLKATKDLQFAMLQDKDLKKLFPVHPPP